MGALEAQLDPARFVRIHRSYFLNIERIALVELYAKDSRVAILRDGTRLAVSRAGYARLARLLWPARGSLPASNSRLPTPDVCGTRPLVVAFMLIRDAVITGDQEVRRIV